MFDIGFPELILVAVVGLLILGPERLPEALRTLGLWIGRLRRSFTAVKAEIEKEIGMDEIKRQLHNEAVMEEMKRLEREVKGESILDTGTQSKKSEPEEDPKPDPIPGKEPLHSDAVPATSTVTEPTEATQLEKPTDNVA